MEVFSLEEDDNSLFITQSDSGSSFPTGENSILGNANDFVLPCVSIVEGIGQHYSDISEDEFDIPSSQNCRDST